MKATTLFVVGLGFMTLTSGCRPYLNPLPDENHKAVAAAFNNIQWYSEAYGFGAISAPLLVEPSEKFKFNPSDATPDTFFKAALNNINGKDSSLYQSTLGGGVGLSATVDFLALQQYLASQSSTNRDTNLLAEKQRLLTEAANRDFQAAMAAAQTIQDPVKRQGAEASAYRALAANLPGPSTAPTTTTPATTPTSAGTGTVAPNAAGLLGMLQAQSLYAAGTPGVSNDMRSALLTAAGDTAINAILALLGTPKDAKSFSDKKLLFGVTEVSVNPGWLTQENFSADITTDVTLDYINAGPFVKKLFMNWFDTEFLNKDRSSDDQLSVEAFKNCIEDGERRRSGTDEIVIPVDLLRERYNQTRFLPYLVNGNDRKDLFVTAVSPMADAQMLDLQSSTQKRREFALQLSVLLGYAGIKGAADSFLKWATQQQQDAQSRTANVVVNSYSLSGGIFGFHIGPRFMANPGSSSAVKERLERQSFPALLLMGFDREALRPRIKISVIPSEPDKPICRVMEPRIELRTTTDWRPLQRSSSLNPYKSRSMKAEEFLRVRKHLSQAIRKIEKCLPPSEEDLSRCVLECTRRDAPNQPIRRSGECISSCYNYNEKNRCNNVLSSDVAEYEHRAAMYRARIVGTKYSFTVPIDTLKDSLVISPPPVPPGVDEIIPTKVQVAAQNKTAGDVVHLLIKGKSLTNVDGDKIAPIIGKVTWVSDQGVPQTAPNARRIGGAILLSFQVSGDDPVIVFSLPIDKDNALTTPPLAVSVAASPAPAKSSTISIDRKQKDGSSETYTFSPDVSDDVKKAVLEKDKPRVVTVKKDETTTTTTTAK